MTSHSSRSTRCCAQSLPICAAGGDTEPAEQLGDIVHAFGLVSVQIDNGGRAAKSDVRVRGSLFADYPRSLDQCHQACAGASGPCALVAGGTDADAVAHMTISNDGSPAPYRIAEERVSQV